MIKISDLISNEGFQRMNALERFNGVPRIHKESVAQHSFWVSLYSNIIFTAVIPMRSEWEYDQQVYYKDLKLSVMEHAMIHDVPEIFTGDVLFDLKYNSLNGEQIRNHIEDYEDHMISEELNNGKVSQILWMLMKRYKQPTARLAKRFVKVADWLACLTYEYNELKLGNRYFENRIFDLSIGQLQAASQNLLDDLVEFYPYDKVEFDSAFITTELINFNLPNPNKVKHIESKLI